MLGRSRGRVPAGLESTGRSDRIGQRDTQVRPGARSRSARPSSRCSRPAAVFEGGAVAIGFATVPRRGSRRGSRGLAPRVSPTRLPRPGPLGGPGERPGRRVRRRPRRVVIAVSLGISPVATSFHLYVNRSAGGLVVGRAGGRGPQARLCGDLDKGVDHVRQRGCEPVSRSLLPRVLPRPFRRDPHHYSTDGGLTWSQPVASSPGAASRGSTSTARSPPSSRTARSCVVLHGVRRSPFRTSRSEIEATRSTDGGALVLGTRPCRIPLHGGDPGNANVRACLPLRSTRPGACTSRGEGCPGAGVSAAASRIVMTTSVDGVDWTPAQAVTAGGSGVDHFLPGLGPTLRRRVGWRSSSIRSPTTAPTSRRALASTSSRRCRRTADARGRSSGLPRSQSCSTRSPAARSGLDARRLRLDIVRPRAARSRGRSRSLRRASTVAHRQATSCLPLARLASRIGILTGGESCPGLNAVIRAVVRRSAGVERGRGACDGWQGLVDGMVSELAARVSGDPAARRNGARNVANESLPRRRRRRRRRRGTSPAQRLDGLVAVGGEDTLGVAAAALCGAPASRSSGCRRRSTTISPRTDYYRSASTPRCAVCDEAIDRLHTTGRVAQPRDGRRGDGPSHGLDRRDERHRRRRGRDPHPRSTRSPSRRPAPSSRSASAAARTSPSSSCQRGLQARRYSPARRRAVAQELTTDEFGHVRLGGVGARAGQARSRSEPASRRATPCSGHVQRGGSPTARDRVLATRLRPARRRSVHEGRVSAAWPRCTGMPSSTCRSRMP